MKIGEFGIPFISSITIHGLVVLLGSLFIHHGNLHRQEFLPVRLIELPQPVIPPSEKKIQAPPEMKKPEPPPPPIKTVTRKPKPEPKPEVKRAKLKPLPPPPAPLKEEPVKAVETKPPPPIENEPAKALETTPPLPAKIPGPPSYVSASSIEGGGSEAGAGKLFENADMGILPGPGTSGGGGGTAVSGLGRGSGPPGLPAQTGPIRTNRQAKPIKTVRAAYPPMALRMGLESDVTLRIEVDLQGRVIEAEVTKSGGAGFDEEALKAVKRSRFEPAQRNGQNVPAEFTYIYRFRLQK